uniref:Piwi domain-containing protein n=1 Tax=Chromera velia CCMP2878 TaxID=1169474 RepID=A0A0G4HAD8_9ALVE|eukprot:Cvel_25642.t1-p1 / transcript=Cvel_25642.t1 / gene=Cvel_25642 / organism=Chromera_velia_CCMP2878 / gene_product=hypothetical protein / transcript_product=hypothetical protein / location=Cvel_scaffold2932:17094-20603(+) / protein_length=221 / sequence_SO=supercontig / SO=protein_coding / is_pseudo=false
MGCMHALAYLQHLVAIEENRGDNAGQAVNYNRVNFPHLIQREVVGFQGQRGFQHWVVVHHAHDEGVKEILMRGIDDQLQMKGIPGQNPRIICINAGQADDFKNQMLGEIQQLGGRPDIVVVILLRQNADRIYAAVKNEFCTEDYACPTQCIGADTLQKKGAQAVAKLVDQMICKQRESDLSAGVSGGGDPTQVYGDRPFLLSQWRVTSGTLPTTLEGTRPL